MQTSKVATSPRLLALEAWMNYLETGTANLNTQVTSAQIEKRILNDAQRELVSRLRARLGTAEIKTPQMACSERSAQLLRFFKEKTEATAT